MKKHTIKKQIYSFCILLLMVCFFACSSLSPLTVQAEAAYSPLSQRFGAWVAAAITALNINLQAITATPIDMVNYISDPFNVAYTYTDQYLDDYFNQSVIQIVPEGTVIDGVTYDDIWLSADAAEKFRTNAFDFVTANSIASNTNGTFASGEGSLNGLPAFDLNGVIRTQSVSVPKYDGTQSMGLNYTWYPQTSDFSYGSALQKNSATDLNYKTAYRYNGNTYTSNSFNNNADWPIENYLSTTPTQSASVVYWRTKTATGYSDYGTVPGSWVSNPFDFDYVAGTIPADAPLADDDGLVIHVPPQPSGSTWQQFKDDHPEFTQPGGIQIDPTIDPDINIKLGSLADILAPIIPIINAEFGDFEPSPVQQTTIADTHYTILDAALDRIHTSIETLGNTVTEIKNAILEDIEIGPLRVFDKALDLISSLFAPVFLFIRTNLSIWSYVVSWLNSISAPLTFIVNSISGTSIMIPVYACVAGTLCIAIYRRFGK